MTPDQPPSKKSKILILGGSSFVGRHLFQRLGPDRAIATYNKRFLPGGVRFDSVSMKLADIIPDPDDISAGVILLGDTNPNRCAEDLAASRALNVKSIQDLIDCLRGWGKKIIFTSSEYVFNGEAGNYDESAPVSPILTYGRQKVEVEGYLQQRAPNAAILRLARVLGDQPGDGTLFSNWLPGIVKGDTIRCASDQTFSSSFVEDVATGILRTLELDLRGIFNLAGPESFRRIELLEMLIREMRPYAPSAARIEPCGINDFPLKERHPINVSLNGTKFVQATECRFQSMARVCRSLVGTFASHKP